MKVWVKSKEVPEGKFLVIRRDGSVPQWPHFVLGARDPAAPAALRTYANACHHHNMDPEYVSSLIELADDFDDYRTRQGNGDPDGAPHRKDNPLVIAVMRGHDGHIFAWHSMDMQKPFKTVAPGVSVNTSSTEVQLNFSVVNSDSEIRAISFEEAWAEMEKQGYQYGEEALEQVRMGWELAIKAGVVTKE